MGGTVVPTSITVSNASYTFASGSLDGSGSLHLMNNATLILDTVDTRTGPTVIDNGSTLQLDNNDTAGSLGSGALTNNGALVFNASGNEAYGYPVYGSGNITNLGSAGTITLGNNLNANHLVQAGGGILLLQGSNSLSGGLVVSSGTVWARSLGALGNAPVMVSGGELQLIYSFDYVAPSMTLSGGLLHGVGGNGIFEGTVVLAADSQINVDNGGSLALNNTSGISGGGYNLSLGFGTGTLILAGTNNSWGGVTINTGTLQIGNGAGGSLGGGNVANAGTLAFDVAGNLVVTNPVTGSGAINQNGPGTVMFTGDLSSMIGNVTVAAGTLGGTSTFSGPVSVLPGGTLAPGLTSTIGTLGVSSDLTLGGNLLVKVNKSLTQSNDLVTVTGALNNTNTGVVTVNNLGPALHAGDAFTLFGQPVTGGASLAISGGGVTWSNNLANDGRIIVLSTVAAYSTNITATVSGSTLTISWPATHLGWVLQRQTNALSAGLSTNWMDVAGSSAVTSTNITISTAVPAAFYRLHHP